MKRFIAAALAAAAAAVSVPKQTGISAGTLVSEKFDFGGLGTAAGYIGVSADDGYDSSKGYGFASTDAVENVTAGGTGALSDAVRFKSDVPDHIFRADLSKGVYKITVTTGDVQSATITAEGWPQLFFLTGKNATDTFTIPVTDGQLDIYAGSGVGTEFSISSIEIEQISADTVTKPVIWIGGDSTAASYYNINDNEAHGWGQYLSRYVDADRYDVRNISASGITSYDLRRSLFGTAEYYGKSGDIMLLAAGINDYTKAYRKNPDSLDSSDYITYMTDMIQRAKKKGMTVYLVKQQGELDDCTQYPLPDKKWFSDAIDEMAVSEDAGIIDLFHPWLEFCLEKTKLIADNYYYNNVHPNASGADKLAQIVSEQLFSSDKPEKVTDDPYTDFDTSDAVSYQTETSGKPVANPHRGFVMTLYNPDMLYSTKHPYGINGSMDNKAWDVVTICSGVMFWKDINPEEDVYNWDEIDKALKACEQSGMTYGIRIIPYTTSSGSDDNYGAEHDFVPQWVYDKGAKQDTATYKYGDPNIKIKVPDWSDPVYNEAYKKFTKALAERYDGDPRVEYVEIRAFGNMGEWHTSDLEGNEMPSVEVQKDMLDYFASVFKNTRCCVLSDAVGEIYDYALSVGITKRNNGLIMARNAEWDLRPAYKANLPAMADNHSTYANMLKQDNTEYLKWTPERFRECIETAHLSIFALDQDGRASYDFYREQKDVIDEMANRLGYNFTVTSAQRNGNRLKVIIKNTGLAPAFFNIKLCAEITDSNGNKLKNFGKPVLIEKGTFHDEDEKAFLFEYDGEFDENEIICLAMYDTDNPLVQGKNPTVKFDNRNNLSTNRLELVESDYTAGDVNSDGVFNVSDFVVFQKWLLAVPDAKLENRKAADLHRDGYLNVSDICMMKRMLINK